MLFKRRKLKDAVEKRDNIINLISLIDSLSFYTTLKFITHNFDFVVYDFVVKTRHKFLNLRGQKFIEFKNLIKLCDKLDGFVLRYDVNNSIIDRYVTPLRKKHIYDNWIFVSNIQMRVIIKNALRDNLLILPTQTEYYKIISEIKQDELSCRKIIKSKSVMDRDPFNGEPIVVYNEQ